MKDKKWKLLSGGLGALAAVFAITALVVFFVGRKTQRDLDTLLENQSAVQSQAAEYQAQNQALSSQLEQAGQERAALQSSVEELQGKLEKQEQQISLFRNFLDGQTEMVKAERITLDGKRKLVCYGSSYEQEGASAATVVLLDEESGNRQDLNVAEKDPYRTFLQDYDTSMFADFNGDGREDIAIQGNYYTEEKAVSETAYFTRLLPFLQQEDGSFAFDKTTADRWTRLGAVSVETYLAAVLAR